MPKQPNCRIAGEFFTWNLYKRGGIWYADGRHNTPNLGKCSLGTRDRDEALRNVHALDRRKAFELKLVPTPPAEAQRQIMIADGWERYLSMPPAPMF